MDELVRVRLDNIEKRLDKTEKDVATNREKLHDYDKTQEVLIANLDTIRQQLERVENKQDRLLKEPTPEEYNNKQKAKSFDAWKWLIIGEVVGTTFLILDKFLGV